MAVRPLRILVATLLVASLAVVLAGTAARQARAALAVPSGFQQKAVITGLTNPTNVQFSPDGRVFVAEKGGVIKMYDSLTDTSPTVYADLRTEVDNYWDRGLLGMALAPDFPADPKIYVLYTYNGVIGGPPGRWPSSNGTDDECADPTGKGCDVSARLAVLSPGGGAVTEKVLVEDWCQQYPSHSVGTIAFGGDGMLYAGGGEGGGFYATDYGQKTNVCGDPPKPAGSPLAAPSAEGGALRAQDLRTPGDPTTLDGGIIRIDPATGAPAAGNPNAGGPDENARRLVAEGLRNPFRFTFRPGTNEIWAGDVGWNTWEEIDRIVDPAAKVTNFGWPCYEGAARQSGYDAVDLGLCEKLYAAGSGAVQAPYYAYGHKAHVVAGDPCVNGSSASISGLAFYTGTTYPPAYRNGLFFADYSRACIWVMKAGANGLPDPSKIQSFATGMPGGPIQLQAGPNGDIFAVDMTGGRILRYVYTAGNNPPTAAIKTDVTSGPLPLTVQFDGRPSSDVEGGALAYAWDLDGDGIFDDGTAPTAGRAYDTRGTVTARLRVTDGQGATDTAEVTIKPGYSPPAATITGPGAGTTWRVGDTIGFSGGATDAEDGALPDAAYDWAVIMHHCPGGGCHEHLITHFTGPGGSFVAPDHEYPSWIELRLTVTDSDGLTGTSSRRLDPKTADVTVASAPGGATLGLLDTSAPAPLRKTVIVRSTVSVAAPPLAVLSDGLYRFASWSDGGAPAHDIVAPATNTTYTATFTKKPNLALKRRVAVSSTYSSTYAGAKAVDGDAATRWSSVYRSPQWIRVDLGSAKSVGRVLLRWDRAYGKAYKIQVSGNASAWTTVYSTTSGDGGIDNLAFTPKTGRYVRMYGTTRATSWGYSLWEFAVYNT
jgi:glucose/arabinose dehydrogenase/PKD repeat protein